MFFTFSFNRNPESYWIQNIFRFFWCHIRSGCRYMSLDYFVSNPLLFTGYSIFQYYYSERWITPHFVPVFFTVYLTYTCNNNLFITIPLIVILYSTYLGGFIGSVIFLISLFACIFICVSLHHPLYLRTPVCYIANFTRTKSRVIQSSSIITVNVE